MSDTAVRIVGKDETRPAFDSVKRNLSGLKDEAGRLNGAFGSLLSGNALSLLGGGLLGAGGIMALKTTIDNVDALDESAQRLSTTVESLSALNFAGVMSGLGDGQMEAGLTKLQLKMADVVAGNKDAVQLFKDLGVTVVDSKGKLRDVTDVLGDLSDVFKKSADGAEKTAAASAIFGDKLGAKWVPLLNEGSAGLEKMRKEAEAFGAVVSGDLAKQAADFNDNLDRLGFLAKSAGNSIASSLLPSLQSVTDQMLAASKAGGGNFWKSLLGFVTVGGDDAENAAKALAEASGNLERMKKMRDDLSAPTWANALNDMIFGDVADLNVQIAAMESRVETLKDLAAQATKSAQPPQAPDSRPPMPTSTAAADRAAAAKLPKSGPLWGPDDAESIMAVLKANEAIEKARASSSAAIAELQRNFAEQNKAAVDAMRIMPEAERELAASLQKVFETTQKVREETVRLHNEGLLSADDYYARLLEITKAEEEQKEKVRALAAEQARLNASWEDGGARAMQAYLDMANNVSAQSQQAFSRAFSAMEDSLVNFVRTGKISFKSLADSIINDMIRIAVRQSVTAPLMQWGMSLMGRGAAPPTMPPTGVPTGGSLGNGTVMSAKGNAFDYDGLVAFAKGGAFTNRIVNRPTLFKFAQGGGFGLGVMGEAGEEAIMPLTRDGQGRLGVRADGLGGGGLAVEVNVINQAQPVQAQEVERRWDGDKLVLGIMLRGIQENAAVRHAIAEVR